jgi:hypothetical protein
MKGTSAFKQTIEAKLKEVAKADPLFAEKLKNEKKNIDDCITYILNTVKASDCNGFADDEIYGMAIHYYEEENIDIGKPMEYHVAVNHKVKLTEEEIQEAKEKAVREIIAEQKKKMASKPDKTTQKNEKKDDPVLKNIISGNIDSKPKVIEQTLF